MSGDDWLLSSKLSILLGCRVVCQGDGISDIETSESKVLNLKDTGIAGVAENVVYPASWRRLTFVVDDDNAFEAFYRSSYTGTYPVFDVTGVKSLDLCLTLYEMCPLRVIADYCEARAAYCQCATGCFRSINEHVRFDKEWDELFVRNYRDEINSELNSLKSRVLGSAYSITKNINIWSENYSALWESGPSLAVKDGLMSLSHALDLPKELNMVRAYLGLGGSSEDILSVIVGFMKDIHSYVMRGVLL